jgi:uncharacterized protein YdaU (DUF1376 family)
MNYFELHIGDLTEATAHLSMVEDGAYGRLMRKYYATERPLPADVKAVQRLVGARTKEEREAVGAVLAEFFDLQEDGWHQARCDAEIAAYQEKAADRDEARQQEKERQRRARERRKQAFAMLREHGVVPRWDTTSRELEEMLSRVTGTSKNEPVTLPVTRDNTASQSPVPSPQYPELASASSARASPTPAGDACRAMRQAGLASVSPSDPRLIALLGAGATSEEFAAVAAEAVAGGKGFAWVLATVEGRRRDASNVKPLPARRSADAEDWTRSAL